MADRTEVMPTPSTVMTMASLPLGHSFVDVLEAAEALAPCSVIAAETRGKAVITRRFGPILFSVLVDAGAAGETRTVTRQVPEFFVDTELARTAVEGRKP